MSDLSNDLFAQAFASAPIGMVLVSIDSSSAGRFVEVNRAFCRMVGRSEEELLGMGFQSVTYPADLDVNVEEISRLTRGETTSVRMGKRYVRPNGEVIWGSWTAP